MFTGSIWSEYKKAILFNKIIVELSAAISPRVGPNGSRRPSLFICRWRLQLDKHSQFLVDGFFIHACVMFGLYQVQILHACRWTLECI